MELEPPTLPTTSRRSKHRRRRRSSARFLRLTGRTLEDEEEESQDDLQEEEDNVADQHLGDMYKKAIRMNAENRINATNSWNLRLIENIDKFLEEDDEDASSSRHTPNTHTDDNNNQEGPLADTTNQVSNHCHNKEKRVNFTKASCTLDASVKIYSYRVDDVHLTSYKVLANLNRTDNGNKKEKNVGSAQSQDDALAKDHEEDEERPAKVSSKSTGTLETNVANINMSKLDSAFDIDPLFHKMSKTFDEGGAKGLLLVNLGVGDQGCNIVFDSKADCEGEEIELLAKKNATSNSNDDGDNVPIPQEERQEGAIDISSLVAKLDTILEHNYGGGIETLSLVPQLAALREQFSQLKEEGFVEKPGKVSKRYASTLAEEKVADMSIHQEAIERSRVSQALGAGGQSFATRDDYDDGDDDDGNGFAFAGGDDDDVGFDNFIANLDDNEPRFSSISFRDSFGVPHATASAMTPNVQTNHGTAAMSQADILLDAICSGNVLGGGKYEYFDTQALETALSGNLWAGATHWKISKPARNSQEKDKQAATKTGASVAKRTKNKKSKKTGRIDLTSSPNLEDLLRKPPKGKRGANPLQLSKVMVAKYTKNHNLLPFDTGVGVDKLTGLFLRPNAVVKPTSSEDDNKTKGKTVCFADDNFAGAAFDDGDNDSFGGGDDNDGPGFALAGDNDDDDNANDFVMEELKAVRRVDTKNVQVGYATIAKKVDVRRLKRDLWSGIESSIITKANDETMDVHARHQNHETSDDESVTKTPVKDDSPTELSKRGLSFQETVREMEESKSQVDATLPFYFICVLHLANEKGLHLESTSLQDFLIHNDQQITAPSV